MMTRPETLARLDPGAQKVVGAEGFLSADLPHDRRREMLSQWVIEADAAVRDLSAFNAAVDCCICTYGDAPARGDAQLAAEVHRTLALSRREAGDFGHWWFLTCFARPDYVIHRWGRDGEVARDRFLGTMAQRTRWYRNAFARLWWGAELTALDGNYRYTDILFGNQDLVETFFGSTIFHYQPAAHAFLSAMAEADSAALWRGVPRLLSSALSMRLLEAMTEQEVRAEIDQILERQQSTRGE